MIETRCVYDEIGIASALHDLSTAKYISFDYETTGLDPYTGKILMAQFYALDSNVCYVVMCNKVNAGPLIEMLASKIVLAHNALFEIKWTLIHYGVHLEKIYCSKLAEQVLTAGLELPADLGATIERRLGIKLDKTLQKSFVGVDYTTFEPTKEQVEYASSDVKLLHQLRSIQLNKIIEHDLIATLTLELQVLPVFASMELAGMRLDKAKHGAIINDLRLKVDHYSNIAIDLLEPYYNEITTREYEQDCKEYERFSKECSRLAATIPRKTVKGQASFMSMPDSNDAKAKLAELRKERDKHKPKPIEPISLTSTAQVKRALAASGLSLQSLDKDSLKEYRNSNEAISAYANWISANKVVSTYGDNLISLINPITERIHPSFNQIVSTGRTSSNSPNAQNMPAAIRHCFIAGYGQSFVIADFANMELRIAAGLSGDKAMIEAFTNGYDLHQLTALAAWPEKFKTWQDAKGTEERRLAKTTNFAAIYGASAGTLVRQGIPDKATAERLILGFQVTYPTLWQWLLDQGANALMTNYAITAGGRKRFFRPLGPEPYGYQAKRDYQKLAQATKRAAQNTPVQGTGADIAKYAMVLVHAELLNYRPARIINLVHDELVIECSSSDAESIQKVVEKCMLDAGKRYVPLLPIPADTHIAKNWDK